MNHRNVCNECQLPGHIARFCPRGICEVCNEMGHIERDCPTRFILREIRIFFPYGEMVRAAVTAAPLREVPQVGANLRLLRDMPPLELQGHRFSAERNVLRIEHRGNATICVAIQDAATEAETLVQIRAAADADGNANYVRVSARYIVQNGRLIEDPDRVATGSQQQQSPRANVHVLTYVPRLMNTMCALEINGRRFYMTWVARNEFGRFNAEVNVTTGPGYNFRLLTRERPLVTDRREYFRGAMQPPAIEDGREIENIQPAEMGAAPIELPEVENGNQEEPEDNAPIDIDAEREALPDEPVIHQPEGANNEAAPEILPQDDIGQGVAAPWIAPFKFPDPQRIIEVMPQREEPISPPVMIESSSDTESDGNMTPDYSAELE